MLKQLSFTRDDLTAALNAAVTEGQVDGDVWDGYKADNPDNPDPIFEAAVQALDSWLTLNPVNNPSPGNWIGEQLTFTLVADVDGVIGGYEYGYRLRWPFHERNRPLTLGTDYVEWRHARGQHDGIEGVVDFLEGVQAEVNASIEGYNESLAPAEPQPADDYVVTWQINVDAGGESWGAANPTEAAVRAGIMLMGASYLADRMADPDAAVVFDVTDRRTGQTTRVDLADEGGKCHTCNADTSDYAPDQQTVCAVCAADTSDDYPTDFYHCGESWEVHCLTCGAIPPDHIEGE